MVAIILGFLVLGEHIILLHLAGIALILSAVAVARNHAVREPARKPRTREPPLMTGRSYSVR